MLNTRKLSQKKEEMKKQEILVLQRILGETELGAKNSFPV